MGRCQMHMMCCHEIRLNEQLQAAARRSRRIVVIAQMRHTDAAYLNRDHMPGHPVDIHVGKHMRQRRTLLGMSQTSLAAAVGLTFQQVQKYERGSNRMGSSRLFEFATILDVPVKYFFEDYEVVRAQTRAKISKRAGTQDYPSAAGRPSNQA